MYSPVFLFKSSAPPILFPELLLPARLEISRWKILIYITCFHCRHEDLGNSAVPNITVKKHGSIAVISKQSIVDFFLLLLDFLISL